MEGQLAEHPLAELVREITKLGLSGALRLSHQRAKVVVYFEGGELIFATSNLRAHRLRETLKRHGIAASDLNRFSAKLDDEDLLEALEASGRMDDASMQAIRSSQTRDALRVALLWTEGHWEFDQRVRLAKPIRVEVDVRRLLLESARHLKFSFVQNRLPANAEYSFAAQDDSMKLIPAEAAVLSRAANIGTATPLCNLIIDGAADEDTLRAIYALSLSELLHCSNWPSALSGAAAAPSKPKVTSTRKKDGDLARDEEASQADVDSLFARLQSAKDHHEVLNVSPEASEEEIKSAYHELARSFHPDRYHQSALRAQIEGAFARIAQAYEVLSDPEQRRNYNSRRAVAAKTRAPQPTKPAKAPVSAEPNRPETCFQRGMDALDLKQHDEAIGLLAEAAMLSPREARYRANYGRALSFRPNMRRKAETELQAAIAIEPDNVEYRLMLAELYQHLRLRRRAEAEVSRALSIDPRNESARALLAKLKHD